jgi:TRAP-type mannitol/chloroaromatic compound transport system substrate-binding protein
VIDATEFSMPDQDITLGFHKIAKYNYYPGWHQQVTISELLMHRAAWAALSKAHQKILEVACGWNTHVNYAETEAMNPRAVNEMKDKYGVTIAHWTDEQLAAFEAAWRDVIEEESASDPEFKKVADSYLAFRKEYKIWGDAQRLNATYLAQ